MNAVRTINEDNNAKRNEDAINFTLLICFLFGNFPLLWFSSQLTYLRLLQDRRISCTYLPYDSYLQIIISICIQRSSLPHCSLQAQGGYPPFSGIRILASGRELCPFPKICSIEISSHFRQQIIFVYMLWLCTTNFRIHWKTTSYYCKSWVIKELKMDLRALLKFELPVCKFL